MNYDLPLFQEMTSQIVKYDTFDQKHIEKSEALLFRLFEDRDDDEEEELTFSKSIQVFLSINKNRIDRYNIPPAYMASLMVLNSNYFNPIEAKGRKILREIFFASHKIDPNDLEERIYTLENQINAFKDIDIQLTLIMEAEQNAGNMLKTQKDRLYFSRKRLLKEKEELGKELPKLEIILKQLQDSERQFDKQNELRDNRDKLTRQTEDLLRQNRNLENRIERSEKYNTLGKNLKEKERELGKKKSKLENIIRDIENKEKFAKQQMAELSKELTITNNLGSNYVNKLEALEKTIFSLGDQITQLESKFIPPHVIEEVDHFTSLTDEYKNRLKAIEYIASQIKEFEIHINTLQKEQKKISYSVDRLPEVDKVQKELNDVSIRFERLKGQEEGYRDGKEQLKNNLCPILEIQCTTIDEPVEDFFDRKIETVSVEARSLGALKKDLEKKLAAFREEQIEFQEWRNIEAKILQTKDIMKEAIDDFAQTEEELENLKFGEDAIRCYTLLENIFQQTRLGRFQKSIMSMGMESPDLDITQRMKFFKNNFSGIAKSWKEVSSYFNAQVNDQKKGLEGFQKQRNSLIVEKDQMRKEYTIICQQAESIEKRRKDLSKILFEAEKTPNINEQIADTDRALERVTHLRYKIKNHIDMVKELKVQKQYEKKEIQKLEKEQNHLTIEIRETEAKMMTIVKSTGGQKKDKLLDEINFRRKEIETIDDKIVILIEQRELIDKQRVNYLQTNRDKKSSNDNEKLDALTKEKTKLERTISKIDKQYYRFIKDMDKKIRTRLSHTEKIKRITDNTRMKIVDYFVSNIYWKKYRRITVVNNVQQLTYWCKKNSEELPEIIVGPKEIQSEFNKICQNQY